MLQDPDKPCHCPSPRWQSLVSPLTRHVACPMRGPGFHVLFKLLPLVKLLPLFKLLQPGLSERSIKKLISLLLMGKSP